MKKIFVIFTSFLCCVITYNSTVTAQDVFFGIGSEIIELEDNWFEVNTNGLKKGEGFVHTPIGITPGKASTLNVLLKGNSKVYLKLEETNNKGTFIKASRSEPIQLTDTWKSYSLKVKLTSKTTQVDVFVLTETKQKVQFNFKDLQFSQK